ncbi:MAG: transglycosylase SLT domain-containing protein [Bacteroidia bacterium]|nr:transglycosylase SLT domain-containing protein [Bacteroidia bacterium]
MSRGKYDPLRHPARPLVMHPPKLNWKNWGLIAAMVVGSNFATHLVFNKDSHVEANILNRSEINYAPVGKSNGANFYMADKASKYIYDLKGFNKKADEVSNRLGIPSEWLMAVIYQESQFNPGVANFQGSGAVGLIQFMPGTASEMGTTTYALGSMTATDQMDYVYHYLNNVRMRYGNYQSLTDLYLGILYPKARGADYCFTLFANPARAYKQNSGLDEDKDGRVTVSDIDKHLKRKYPEAYIAKLDH